MKPLTFPVYQAIAGPRLSAIVSALRALLPTADLSRARASPYSPPPTRSRSAIPARPLLRDVLLYEYAHALSPATHEVRLLRGRVCAFPKSKCIGTIDFASALFMSYRRASK
ncbi:hypothetical protein Tco_1514562 [Tanacetum coccineum]